MTRRGKIARLPCSIREELNQRIEDGEQGTRLVEWLNSLPEVMTVLAQDFEGQAISESNLTLWRNGGFLDWQARRDARAVVEEWRTVSPTSEAHPPASDVGATSSPKSEDAVMAGSSASSEFGATKVAEALTERLMAHYAAALEYAIGGTDEKARKHVERLGRLLQDV